MMSRCRTPSESSDWVLNTRHDKTNREGGAAEYRRLSSPPKFFWNTHGAEASPKGAQTRPSVVRVHRLEPRSALLDLKMPHSKPDGPLAKRQKVSSAVDPATASANSSRIFAPFRVGPTACPRALPIVVLSVIICS